MSADRQAENIDGPAPVLRVLTYLNSFQPGGVERVALRLNATWQTQGISARVVVGRNAGLARDSAHGLDCTTLLDGSRWYHRWRLIGIFADLPGIIRKVRPDVLFCAGNTYSLAMVLMRLRLGRACPPIIAKISNDLERRDQTPLVRFFYHKWLKIQGRYIDHFVGMATPMRREIEEYCGVSPARVTIINDPVLYAADVARLGGIANGRPPAARGRRFLAIGRLSPQKNLALLLEAFSRMAAADDRLTIIGEGPDRKKLAAQATRLGIAERVDMPGFMATMDRWLAWADTLILSSDYEGVPAVIIEAMAASLPIIATNCSVSMAELTGHGRFARLVPVGDAAALTEAMAAPPPARPGPAAARAHVAAFTVEQGAADYARLMRAVAGRGRATITTRR